MRRQALSQEQIEQVIHLYGQNHGVDFIAGELDLLRPRLTHRKSSSEISTLASAKVFAREYRQDSIISFLPENPQLEADWRCMLSKVRQERAAAQEAARV